MSNVREIGTNFQQLVAEGLEETARAVRAGELTPHRAFIVMVHKEHGADVVSGHMFGAEASLPEVVGMLECAKHETIAQG